MHHHTVYISRHVHSASVLAVPSNLPESRSFRKLAGIFIKPVHTRLLSGGTPPRTAAYAIGKDTLNYTFHIFLKYSLNSCSNIQKPNPLFSINKVVLRAHIVGFEFYTTIKNEIRKSKFHNLL